MSPAQTLFLPLALLAMAATLAAEPEAYRPSVERFVVEMSDRHGFEPASLKSMLDQARYSQAVIDAMRRPYEGLSWRDYRPLFLTPERIQGGVAFWRANAETLARASATYGVAPEIIVAIIGVETNYGANTGAHPVLDALTTLGFSYPERADFFRSELEQFLLLTREERIDPLAARGSYAGALGKPQFIPSSYRVHAVDFDGDGRRDLWNSNPDVIGSVANYFKNHGWQSGAAVAIPLDFQGEPPLGIEIAEKAPLKPALTAHRLRDAGISWPESLEAVAPVSLIRLDGVTDEYWIGLENFYVLTRYNHSNLYAMAVHRLSEEIRARYGHAG